MLFDKFGLYRSGYALHRKGINFDADNLRICNVAYPKHQFDTANKKFVITHFNKQFSQFREGTAYKILQVESYLKKYIHEIALCSNDNSYDAKMHRICNIHEPESANDAVNKEYLESRVKDLYTLMQHIHETNDKIDKKLKVFDFHMQKFVGDVNAMENKIQKFASDINAMEEKLRENGYIMTKYLGPPAPTIHV